MLTRVEETTFLTADDFPFRLHIVYYYEKRTQEGVTNRYLSAKVSLTGILPMEGWENKDDLPTQFHGKTQRELRDSIRRFIDSREAKELEQVPLPKMIAVSRLVREEDE